MNPETIIIPLGPAGRKTNADSGEPPSVAARRRLLSQRAEPLFYADWMRVLMIHFEVEALTLQRDVPFELDLLDGRAFVTVVAFTMENMRPRRGGRIAAWLFRPIATHEFFNIRTYVRHKGERGIHFMAEWLSNRLAVKLGPGTFALPYHYGKIAYDHSLTHGRISGRVMDAAKKGVFSYRGKLTPTATFTPCEPGSIHEGLMERYIAFNCVCGRKKLFRVWHAPWLQQGVTVEVEEISLLTQKWQAMRGARIVGANFSPGLKAVWMGRPYRIDR